jgi:hypothetical protein
MGRGRRGGIYRGADPTVAGRARLRASHVAGKAECVARKGEGVFDFPFHATMSGNLELGLDSGG